MCIAGESCRSSSDRSPRPGAGPPDPDKHDQLIQCGNRGCRRMNNTGSKCTVSNYTARKRPDRRLVIVVRADPVICGHSGEARNLAEVALTRGFDDVRLLTWPIATLEAAGLPLKPLDRLQPYSDGITVERPDAVGDYRVPDGRHLAGLVGRLVELLAEGVPTTCLSMYLAPHANVVIDAVNAARAAELAGDVHTIAKAVGSDVTNVIRSCLSTGRVGEAAVTLTT